MLRRGIAWYIVGYIVQYDGSALHSTAQHGVYDYIHVYSMV